MLKLKFWENPFYAKYLLAAIVGLLIALFFSFSNQSKFVFEEGQKWQYDDLYAANQILVPLAKSTIDSLSKNSMEYTPVFQYHPEIFETKKADFKADFERALSLAKKDNSFPDVSKNAKVYLQFADDILGKIYEKGVLPQKIKAEKVKILRGNLMTEVASNKVFDAKSAFNYLTDTLPYSNLREPEFLLNVLESKIIPNLTFDENQNEQGRQKITQQLENQFDTIKSGDLIIKKGRKINAVTFRKLSAFQEQHSPSKIGQAFPMRFLVFALFSIFCLFVLTTHFAIHQEKILQNHRLWSLLMALILGLNIVHFFVIGNSNLHPLATPFLIVPMLLRKKINVYPLAILYIITIILASQIAPMPYSFSVALIIAGFFMSFVRFFDDVAFGKIWLTLSSLSILSFIFYVLSFQQNIIFDPINILIFIGIHGLMVLISIFFERFVAKF